jgi:hypothetical protein
MTRPTNIHNLPHRGVVAMGNSVNTRSKPVTHLAAWCTEHLRYR